MSRETGLGAVVEKRLPQEVMSVGWDRSAGVGLGGGDSRRKQDNSWHV